MKFNLKKIAGIIPVGLSEAKRASLESDVAVGRAFTGLFNSEHWPAQVSLETQIYNNAISGLRKDKLTENERIAFNAIAVTIENMRTARKAAVAQSEIAQKELKRLTDRRSKL